MADSVKDILNDLTASAEWRVLGDPVKKILRDALVNRDLVGSIASHMGVTRDTALQVACGLLNDTDVLPLVIHATGISLKAPTTEAVAAAAVSAEAHYASHK
jgi:hypothetical protein